MSNPTDWRGNLAAILTDAKDGWTDPMIYGYQDRLLLIIACQLRDLLDKEGQS